MRTGRRPVRALASHDMRSIVLRRASATVLVAVVLTVLVTAACAGAPAGSASASSRAAGDGSATAIVQSLGADGLECTNASPRTIATYVADAVACSVGDEDVVVRTFGSTDDRDRFVQTSTEFTEQLSVDIEALPRLLGPTWLVTTDSTELAQRIQSILGGELR